VQSVRKRRSRPGPAHEGLGADNRDGLEDRRKPSIELNALPPKDWADIALKLADRYDPFYQPGFEEKFNRLRRNILKMEEEAEAERA